ncbi:AI-2E family transporter [Methylosinus sp. KRF6]|uniref:AI-2E family transporter n=1 Tax=Methylosinus sp. KRF6 TaxID=2846853 RepID=UPI001C0CD8EF|nr:AI-2E family transporter [Methylosinus sp. KRF6]MBU3887877.1 AI-2E family transporter [Methylosinus sp. KRF6]
MQTTLGEFSKRAAVLVAFALVPVLVWRLFDVILILIGAGLFAILIEVVAEPFRWVRLPKSLALLLSGIVIACVIIGTGYLFGTRIAEQMDEVIRRAQEAQGSIVVSLESSRFGKALVSHIQAAQFPVTEIAARFFSVSTTLLAAFVVTIFLGIYVAAQPVVYRDGVIKLFPPHSRARVGETIEAVANALRFWLFGQLIEMAIIAILSGLAVWMIGLPSPIALGIIAGVAEFVPYLGPIIAAIPAVLVATTLGLGAVIWTLTAYMFIHQAEGQLIMPIIQRRMVYVPPALMLASIITLTYLFGLTAAIFAAPITVILFVTVNKLYVRDSLGEPVALPGEDS